MNILFLTMNPFTGIDMHNIYSDLMLEFIKHGHRPYIVTPREKKQGDKTELLEHEDYSILKVLIGNTSGVGLIEKGISTVTLGSKYYRAVRKYLGHVNFELILYSTPPITLATTVKKLKKRFGCSTYLMLKDIFPQNAVDLGMFSRKSILYHFFSAREKLLYQYSDRIGCMSRANVEYLKSNYSYISAEKIGICHNGIILRPYVSCETDKCALRKRFGIPTSATVYLFGGNLGKPQAVSHLVECLKVNREKKDRFFFICGSGGEYERLASFFKEYSPSNMQLIDFLPKSEYDKLVRGCDVGLIFLDARFTIPNYPSRILSYMEYAMPIIACTDKNTDVGSDAVENGYGFWCESKNPADFTVCIDKMNRADKHAMGCAARVYLENNFTAEQCYQSIMG